MPGCAGVPGDACHDVPRDRAGSGRRDGPVTRGVVVALVVIFAALILLRERLLLRPVIELSDAVHDDLHRPRARFNLPPSGFLPGEQLLDTIKNDKLQSPPFMPLGIYAYRRYLVTPKAERLRVRASLDQALWPVDRWLDDLTRRNPGFICIGESHQDSYRDFLATRFFPRFPVDVLFLETVPGWVPVLTVRSRAGEDDVDLLRADIADVIRAVRTANPAVEIHGAEETARQRRARRRVGAGGRDESLYDNVMAAYRPGRRNAALLGALHCTRGSSWLYAKLTESGSPVLGDGALNLAVMSRRKDILTREFMRFARLVGFQEGDLVLHDTALIDDRVHDWFLGLTRHFGDYRTVVLFTGGGDGAVSSGNPD